jgi:hypothetical protein
MFWLFFGTEACCTCRQYEQASNALSAFGGRNTGVNNKDEPVVSFASAAFKHRKVMP